MREQEQQQVCLELVVVLVREVEPRMALLEEVDEIESLDGFLQLLKWL